MSTVKDSIVEEGNEIIRNFMGYSIIYGEKPFVPFYPPYGMSDEEYQSEVQQAEAKVAEWEYHNRLQYDTSWDWLMPVFIKIKNTKMIKGSVLAQTNMYEHIEGALVLANIEKLWHTIVQFIKWYNQQFPSPNKPTT